MMEKLIFLALDGLSWNVINEMLSENKLKNLKKLIDEGASGIMKADFPLISPKIWASIFTGKKPEKHGILDFYSTKEDLREKLIWEILHKNNRKLGIYRPLTTWDALEVDGFFVPGFLSHKSNSHPEDLNVKTIFDRRVRRIRSEPKDDMKEFYNIRELELKYHTELFINLIKKYRTDFSLFYDLSCDKITHFFWKEKIQNTKYSDLIPKIYSIIDRFIGKILKYANKNKIHVLIVSDHGFKGITGSNAQKNIITLKITNLLKTINLDKDVYGSHFDILAIFRIKPGSSISFNDFKEKLNSIKYLGETLFDSEEFEKWLIVKVKDLNLNNQDLIADLSDGSRIRIESIFNFNTLVTGSHSEENGVFIMYGPSIKTGEKLNEVKPYDITPTILSLMNLSIPLNIDGRVLKEIFKEQPAIKYHNEEYNILKEKNGLSKDEEDIIKKKLRSMGYL